jgi:hypothetical protein
MTRIRIGGAGRTRRGDPAETASFVPKRAALPPRHFARAAR